MEKDFTQLVVFDALEPSISFVSKKGIYLSSEDSKNIAVNIVSVPKVRVTIKKVYENNIVHFMRSNRYHSYEEYYYDEEDGESRYYGYRYNDYKAGYYSDVVFDQWYETKNLPKQNGVYLLNLS